MGEELGAELFFAIYLGLVGVVFAMGPPENASETRWRSVTLVFCAVLAVVMICWLALRVIAALFHIIGAAG
jgi:hypothetical protein